MKLILIIALALTCSACGNYLGLTTDQQVANMNKCKSAGLVGIPRKIKSGKITRIDCASELSDPAEICAKRGGVPIRSFWDGEVTRCEFKSKEALK